MSILNKTKFQKWLCNLINIIIDLFFVFAVLSTLYVFTYPFKQEYKVLIFIVFIILFCIIVYILRNSVKHILSSLIKKLSKLNTKQMLIIISVLLIILKIIYTAFCYFDPSTGGSDIAIYNEIANSIVNAKAINGNEISHLLGVSLHLSVFKLLNVRYDVGIFVLFSIGTIVNFLSFKELIGKEKSFLLVTLYMLMPSTILLTFCPTHELFVYFYLSIFIYLLYKFITTNKKLLLSFLILLDVVLLNFVSPMGTIIYIILILFVLFTNLEKKDKLYFAFIVILSLILSKGLVLLLNMNEDITNLNTMYILVRGSSIECMGEHVDYYTKTLTDNYLKKHNLKYSFENEMASMKDALINRYSYLFTHPIDFIRLLIHKFYVEWSGDHYSIEMAYNYNSISNIVYYVFLSLSALIYLFVNTISLIYYGKKEDNIVVSTIKLLLLGVVAMLLISLVLNKYSVYMTIFIYFIAFYRIEINEK